jgi:hypothetical protein
MILEVPIEVYGSKGMGRCWALRCEFATAKAESACVVSVFVGSDPMSCNLGADRSFLAMCREVMTCALLDAGFPEEDIVFVDPPKRKALPNPAPERLALEEVAP